MPWGCAGHGTSPRRVVASLQAGMTCSVVTYNILISGCARNGMSKDALVFLEAGPAYSCYGLPRQGAGVGLCLVAAPLS